MKVLLCEDVERLGFLGDIIEVKEGFARNYLLPQRLAIVPTDANIRSLAQARARGVEARKMAAEQQKKLADAVNGTVVVIARKANEQGHLFGSVTEADIAEALRAQNHAVSDGMVQLKGHIKEVGKTEVVLKIGPELTATVSVEVKAGDQALDTVEQETKE